MAKKKRTKRSYTNTKAIILPARFVPKFLDDADGRPKIIKELRRRLVRLKDDVVVILIKKICYVKGLSLSLPSWKHKK